MSKMKIGGLIGIILIFIGLAGVVIAEDQKAKADSYNRSLTLLYGSPGEGREEWAVIEEFKDTATYLTAFSIVTTVMGTILLITANRKLIGKKLISKQK